MYLSMSSGPPIPYGKGSSAGEAVIFKKIVFNEKALFFSHVSKTQFWPILDGELCVSYAKNYETRQFDLS